MAEEKEKEEKKAPPAKKEARKSKRTGEGEKAEKPEKPGKSEKTDAPEKGPKKRRRTSNRKGKRNRQCWARKEAMLKWKAAQEDSEEEEGEESEEEGAEEGAASGEGGQKKRRTKANRLNEANYDRVPRGVIFIGQLPMGFEEMQIKQYFRQFGRITRFRLARGKKTGRTRGYGWVEFEEREVAEVVAKTMDKYMMFGKVLQVVLMPPEKVPPGVFRRWNKPWVALGVKRKREFNTNFNDRPTIEVDGEQVPQRTWAQVRRRDMKMNKLKEKLENLGIEYDLTPFLERHDEETAKCEAEFEEKKAAKITAAEAAEAAKAQRKAAQAAKRAAKEPAKEPERPAAEAPKASNVEEAPDANGEAKAKKKKRKAAEAEAEEAQPSGEAEGAPEKKKKKKKAQEA